MTSQSHPTKTALLLIDVQEGFLHPTHWGPSRSNPDFEQNASSLLNSYRSLITSSPSQHKIVHIQHSSRDPNSELHPSSPGFAFQEFAMPKDGELVIVKEVNSALIGTNLEEVLRGHFVGRSGKLYIAGLSTDHCCSTTTRMAGNLGVADGVGEDGGKEVGEVVFVEDATAAWRKGEGDEWCDAEVVHRVNVESLREFGRIGRTEGVIGEWEGIKAVA